MERSRRSSTRDQNDEFDLQDLETSLEDYRNSLVVHNMAVMADTGVTLDLAQSLNEFGNSIYEKKEFNCIRLDVRIKKELDSSCRMLDSREFEQISTVKVLEATKAFVTPSVMSGLHKHGMERCKAHGDLDPANLVHTSVKVSVFSNGKLSVTGARSLLSATVALEKVCRAVRRRINKKARLCHITCTNILVVYGYPNQIVLPLFHRLYKGSSYDPIRFSGVRVRVPINSVPIVYNIYKVLYVTGFSTKYAHMIREEGEAEPSDEPEESEDESTTPTFIPNAVVAPPVKRYKPGKIGIQRFVDSTMSDNRKVHNAAPVAVKRKKTRLPKNVSIWSNTNLLDSQVNEEGETLPRFDPFGKSPKEEVVTVNVFSSGNMTFTGARSISSVQMALSHIYPFLNMATRKT
ncbi:uncharacterized protein TOT_010001251 [Theileria orientalis strain Shintoku]|uniref:Uncharacterized protein n=1 Tax=Theileria orientalis strain Shintoku TaxID=869250 RepID=J4DNG4_THEOR|nr:uncharacterized protein TOT_010001251 [Theileria orientalis strain Shintoku]PVC52706.1 hypothetical protein MACL_00000571 [Theileria orientalis]BAM38914.1 uncharacterized protein TOT_010001251 [Theileria orientalis strain Shintoku]|eukprot:XP_009689215.1 uncharacterized protein TOT_010001251 [Theileria orientalis strain Shintoku]